MTIDPRPRRAFLRTAAIGAFSLAALATAGGNAQAYQGNMERALQDLRDALGSLHQATSDKGGHKAAAVDLIQQAISQVEAGIAYAAERFGD